MGYKVKWGHNEDFFDLLKKYQLAILINAFGCLRCKRFVKLFTNDDQQKLISHVARQEVKI